MSEPESLGRVLPAREQLPDDIKVASPARSSAGKLALSNGSVCGLEISLGSSNVAPPLFERV